MKTFKTRVTVTLVCDQEAEWFKDDGITDGSTADEFLTKVLKESYSDPGEFVDEQEVVETWDIVGGSVEVVVDDGETKAVWK